jgi:DinB family
VQLYSTRLDSTESTALPLPSANLASISSTGMLAILVGRDPQTAVIAEVSLAGGAPRELVETEGAGTLPLAAVAADWAPGYAISHDAHHRGQICQLARQTGFPLANGVTYGMWDWSKRQKEI